MKIKILIIALLIAFHAGAAIETNVLHIRIPQPTNSLSQGTAKNEINWEIASNAIANGFGGGGGCANCGFIEESNGVGTNTTVFAPFTLTTTNAYYFISGVLYTNSQDDADGLTPVGCGYVWTTGPQPTSGILTNCHGKVISNLLSATLFCTNWAGPYGLNSTLPNGTKVYTNACNYQRTTNSFTCDDPSGPYLLNTNIGPNAYTNACLFLILGTRPCPNSSGPYFVFSTNSDGSISLTNTCGNFINARPSSLCLMTPTPETLFVTNDFKINGLYKRYDPFGILFTNTYRAATNAYPLWVATNIVITISGGGYAPGNGVYYQAYRQAVATNENANYFDGLSVWTNSANVNVSILDPGVTWVIKDATNSSQTRYSTSQPTNGTWTLTFGSGPAPTPTGTFFFQPVLTNLFTNVETVTSWAQYLYDKDVQFFWATNAIFSQPATIVVVGSYTEQFFITNVGVFPASLSTNVVYLGNNGQRVTTTKAVNTNYNVGCGSFRIGGLSYGITTIFPGQPVVPVNTNPPCSFPPRDEPTCSGQNEVYLIIGCDCKHLKNGSFYKQLIVYQQQTLGGSAGNCPRLSIDNSGTSTLWTWQVGAGGKALVSRSWNWANAGEWETNSPADPCAYQGGYFYSAPPVGL